MSKFKHTEMSIATTSSLLKLAGEVKPKWIETISRSQSLLNSNTYLTGATEGLKVFTESHKQANFSSVNGFFRGLI